MENLLLGSTIVFAPYSLDQALEGLAEAGYRNCEIGAVKGWFEHIDPDTATRQVYPAEAKLKEPVSAGQSERPYPTPNAGRKGPVQTRDRDRRRARHAIINTYTGDATTHEEREAYFANVADFCDYAKKPGLKIGMETDSNMLPTAKAGVEILRPHRSSRCAWLQLRSRQRRLLHRRRTLSRHPLRPAADGPFPFQGQDRRQGRLQFPARRATASST